MIINNSKKSLAAKIRNSGFVWPDSGKWAIQDKDGEVFVCSGTSVPVRRVGEVNWEFGEPYRSVGILSLGSNWFQCILSRDEYFHLYPAPDADGWIEWKGGECPIEEGTLVDVIWRNGIERAGVKALHLGGAGRQFWVADGLVNDIIAYRLHKPKKSLEELCGEVKEENKHEHIEAKPTIEQLAADYRNLKDFADRKQQEAKAAKADAEAKLAEMVAAGKALGLALSVTGTEPEPNLVIIDWRDLRVGDVIWYGGDDELSPGEYHVMEIEAPDYEGYRTVLVNGVNGGHWIDTRESWGFIRRPTKGGADA